MNKLVRTIRLRDDKNYGALTDISIAINNVLGDNTGRSVSRRTAQGFKETFNLTEMSDDFAEDIVHAGMITTAALLRNKNSNAKLAGALLGIGLTLCYKNGK